LSSALSKGKQATASVGSVMVSLIASSHHWIHMIILICIGGSMSTMEGTMSAVIWIRRLMIVMTCVTVLYVMVRLMKHKNRNSLITILTLASTLISTGLMVYTLAIYGW